MQIKLNNDRQGISETNDCTVRAISNAFNIPYAEAHAVAEKAGRKKGKGFRIEKILLEEFKGKKKTKWVQLPIPISLDKFIGLTSQRTQIVLIRKHVFVAKKRIIHDHMEPKKSSLVSGYWIIGVDEKEKFECPIRKSLPNFGKDCLGKTQEDVITYLGKKGYSVDEISEFTGIQKANVSHLYCKLKIN